MKRTFALSAALFMVSGAALAFHCPADMKAIDAAMATNPKLSEADMKSVKQLRSEGEAFHKAGKHPEAVDSLAKAMKILKIDAAAAPKK